jgi:hypothetical protein
MTAPPPLNGDTNMSIALRLLDADVIDVAHKRLCSVLPVEL